MDMTAVACVAAGAAMGITASAAALMGTVGLGCLPACMFTVSAISGAERSDSGGDGVVNGVKVGDDGGGTEEEGGEEGGDEERRRKRRRRERRRGVALLA